MRMNGILREYIDSKGMYYGYIAKRAGINEKKFSRLVTSRQKLTLDDYESICRALNVPPGHFYSKEFLKTK